MGSRKIGKPDPNQSLLIGDDMLIEILSRIPTSMVAIRCKLVCKGWCSLISSPCFIRRFKQQHIMHESRYPKPLLGMLANTVSRVSMENPDDDEFNFRCFNLDYLPEKIVVLASCNDLILCRESCTCNYYLCNPFTMQWVALPSPEGQGYTRTGLVCVPGGGGTIDDRLRYRIVCFHTHKEDRRRVVEMYCSETREWTRCDDDYSNGVTNIAAHNGKLYWVNRDGKYLVTYDPFDMRQTSARLIDGPKGDDVLWMIHFSHVRECEGVLRVLRFELGGTTQVFNGIRLWELQEGKVIFKERIVFNQDMSRLCASHLSDVAGFHPRNKDVLFLMSRDSLVSFNTKTREFTVETQFKKDNFSYRYACPLQLPWWPTQFEEGPAYELGDEEI